MILPVFVGLTPCDNYPMTPSVIPTDGDKQALVARLRQERAAGVRGGIYHRLQVEMTYNSNHIEGSQLTRLFIIEGVGVVGSVGRVVAG